jgi:hypothetical protein
MAISIKIEIQKYINLNLNKWMHEIDACLRN